MSKTKVLHNVTNLRKWERSSEPLYVVEGHIRSLEFFFVLGSVSPVPRCYNRTGIL